MVQCFHNLFRFGMYCAVDIFINTMFCKRIQSVDKIVLNSYGTNWYL